MAKYVDGFVIPIPKDKVADYAAMAKKAAKIFIEHGALEVYETVLEDADCKFGTPFPKFAKIKEGQTVVFSWIVYKSRAQRDKANAKVMADPRMSALCDPENPPFDCKKMTYGGFDVIVAATA